MAPKKRTQDVEASGNWSFSSLLLSKHVLDGLEEVGFKKPSPVQVKSIPLGKCGLDLIVQAKSGTGKTCVFAIVALEMVSTASLETQVIVLAPTREIAVQIYEFFCSISSSTHNLHNNIFIGGTAIEEDKKKLSKCQIVIGTPGRVKSLIGSGLLQTHAIRLFVLDEADKLLEPGSFQDQINWIYSTLPKNKQVLALSATYPEYLAVHLTNYMNEPAHVRLNSEQPTLIGIKQLFITVESHHLPHVVFEKKAKRLTKFLRTVPFQQCMVFSNYQARAQLLADMLSNMGWPASCIAGNQSQDQRFEAMKQLKDFKCRILISTDLTSRGIDCDKVDLVINLDMPWDTETYLHRVGRAGRFGNYGLAVSFVSKGKEEEKLQNIAHEIKYTIAEIPDIGKIGSISDVLSNKWERTLDTSDDRDLQLDDTCPLEMISEGPLYNEKDSQSNFSNGEINVLDSSRNVLYDFSITSKRLLEDVEKSSTDLVDHSKDSLGLVCSLDIANGECFNQGATSLHHFDFHLSSNNKSTKDIDFDLTQNDDKTSQGLDILECNIKDTAEDNNCLCEFDLVTRSRISSKDSLENCEQSRRLLLKKNSGRIQKEQLNVRDNGKVNCKFMMQGSESLQRSPDADKCPTKLCGNNVTGSLEGESAENTAGEVQVKNFLCQNLSEFNKDENQISTIELESMLGDLLSEKFIESGASMLRDYYSSKGVLTKSNGVSDIHEGLNVQQTIVNNDGRYKSDMLLANFRDHLPDHKREMVSTCRNLDETQESLRESIENWYCGESDLQKSGDLLLSEAELNGYDTISLQPGDEYKQTLSESLGSFQDSAEILDENETGLCQLDIKPEMFDSRLDLDSMDLEDDRKTKSKDKIETALAEPVKIVSHMRGNVSRRTLAMKGKKSSAFDNRPDLTNPQVTDGDSVISLSTDSGHIYGSSTASYERDDRLYERAGQRLSSHCAKCGEILVNESQKLKGQGAKYSMPIHNQNLASNPLDHRRRLYSMKKATVARYQEVMESFDYGRFYGAWNDIYRKQVAWMNYHSTQYRKSASYFNEIFNKYWL